MTALCDFHPLTTEPRSKYRCSFCGHVTPIALAKPPHRRCESPNARSQSETAPVRHANHWLTCPHRGIVLATISGTTAGVGCGSTKWEVYQCNHFNEPVLKQAAPRCQEKIAAEVAGYKGRTCRECKVVQLQRLIVHVTYRPDWQDVIQRSLATGADFAFREMTLSEKDLLARAVAAKPVIVVNHAFFEHTDEYLTTAKKHPEIQFLGLNHCSLNHAYRWPHYYTSIRKFLNAMEEIPNIWYGGPDMFSSFERFRPAIADRIIWWPNPVLIPPSASTVRPDPPVVMLACRDDWIMKGVPAQMVGMALAKQKRPEIKLQVSLRFAGKTLPHMRALENALRTEFEWPDFLRPNDWYRRLDRQASIVMQATDHESFGYVAIDAMGYGRPVVCGPSVRFAPREWVVDTEIPEGIAAMILDHLDHYEDRSRIARQFAEQTAERQNTAYRELLERIAAHGRA